MVGLPHRYTSMSDERCSEATSGVYSAAESDGSNSTEQSEIRTKYNDDQSFRIETLGLPEVEKHLNQNIHKNNNLGKRHISKIPPPKPLRYHLYQTSRNSSYSRANSEDSTIINQASSRIPQHNEKKSGSCMNINLKKSHILV